MSTRLTDAELRAALELAAKATPGPWTEDTQLGIDDLASADTAFVLAARDGWPAAAKALLEARELLRVFMLFRHRRHAGRNYATCPNPDCVKARVVLGEEA